MEYTDLKKAIIEQNLGLKNFVKKGTMMITDYQKKIELINHVTNQYTRLRIENGGTTPEKEILDYQFDSPEFKQRLIYDAFLTYLSKVKLEVNNWKYFILTDKMLVYSSNLLITALILFKRYVNECKKILNDVSYFIKTFLGCILIASKFIDDFSFYSEDFMKKWDIEPESICRTEMDILCTVNFNVNIKDSEYKWVIKHIKKVK